MIVTVGLAEGIIDDTCLVVILFKGLHIQVPEKWERRKDFGGMRIVQSVLILHPFVMFDEGYSNLRGLSHDIVSVLSGLLNFTMHFVSPADGTFGLRAENETNFSGIIGMLQRSDYCQFLLCFCY